MAPGNTVDRYRPACCAAVENFVHARHDGEHRRKISGARSLINNAWKHREAERLQASKKSTRLGRQQGDRFVDIERENMRLLLRMEEINHRGMEVRRDEGGGASGKAAARILLGAPQQQGPTRSIARCSSLPAMGRGSNADARMREMRRIDEENSRLLKRLQSTKPCVSKDHLEEQHRAQHRVMRMRQEHAPPMPGPRRPLPFSRPPRVPEDPESERLQDLQNELQRRVAELEEQDRVSDGGPSMPASPVSVRSSVAAADPDADQAVVDDERRDFIGGQLPEHSRALVEQLMRDNPVLPSPKGVAAPEEDPEDGKDAVVQMLARAEALEAQEFEPLPADYLSYENVVQRSRASLQAANLMMGAARR